MGGILWLCVLLGGLHKVLFGCLCCCGGGVQWPPRGASDACCRLAWCGGDHWSLSRVSWAPVSSHLLHVTCVGDADLVFENLFSSAKTSRSFSSSSYSLAMIISVSRSDTLYAPEKIRRLGVQFSLMTLNVSFVE